MISQQLPDLPLDIITNVFTRLPVKTLIRFKCVSKFFLSLISNRQFIKTHLNRSSKNLDCTRVILNSSYPLLDFKSYSLHSVLYSHPHNAQELDYPLNDTGHLVLIVGSYNGLVCIAIQNNLFIWNPSTRALKELHGTGLEFNHPTTYRFGFDERIDDYKVVGISGLVGDGGFKTTRVYSLRADSWKIISDFPGILIVKEPGKFVSGSLHWVEPVVVSPDLPVTIVSLDLVNETYSEIELPNYDNTKCYFILGVLQGCLCVMIDIIGDHSGLWIMKEYKVRDSWVKLRAIPHHVDPRGLLYSIFIPLLDF